MRAPFPSLLRFYVASFYGLPGKTRRSGGDEGQPATRGKGNGARSTMRSVGIALLVFLLAGDIVALFSAMDLAMYAALKPLGLQGLLLLNAITTASLFVFVLGFVAALSTYYLSGAETALLALPLKPRHLLGAKIASVYLSEFAMAFLLVGVGAAIYGIKEAPPPGFYAAALVAALSAPLLPLAASYVILVPLMRAMRPFRSKNAMMIVGGLVGAAFAVALNVYVQTTSARLGDSGWMLANIAGPDAVVARLGSAYPPAYLAWLSMTARGPAAAAFALAGLALGVAAVGLAAWLLGPAYAASLLGFEERMLKRLASTKEFIDRTLRARRAPATLFLREWRLLNREPVYFLNGPFVIVLVPIIMVIMFFAQREALAELLAQLGDFREGPGGLLAAAAAGGFLGSSTSIACTALSRDAKVLPYLKALPLRYSSYLRAKLLHALVFSGAGAAIGAVGLGLAAGLGAIATAGAFAIAIAFSAFVDIMGLWLDTANPRLSWDSPTAALKRNPNAIISILGTMTLIGALGYVSSLLHLDRALFVALYAGGFGLAAAAALAAYTRYARLRISAMEI